MCKLPEGPEVERVKLDLLPVINKTIQKSYFTPLALKYTRYSDPENLVTLLESTKLISITRKGKFLIWKAKKTPKSSEIVVLNHLGMTGSWELIQTPKLLKERLKRKEKNYTKVVLEFDDGTSCIFVDMRNFGRFHVFKDYKTLITRFPAVKKLGLDGFHFSLTELKEQLELKRNKTKPIGILLLDQRFIAGVGNIYKSESLWRAKINPLILAENLNENEIKNLVKAVQSVLQDALNDGGSTINNFQSNNVESKAQDWHAVYAREGKECINCKKSILKVVQGGRSTFYCGTCQPLKINDKK